MPKVEDLDKILELEGNATPAGWPVKVKNAYSSGVTYSMGAGPEYLSGIAGDKLDSIELERLKFATHDAELIAVARNNIKALCLELKAARPLIEQIGFYRDIQHHSEDCDYGIDKHGEYNPECPTAIKICECGINETKDLLKKYDEATK